MSFIRAATTARAASRRFASTSAPSSGGNSNFGLLLGGAGIAGLGGYLYLNYADGGAVAAAVKPKATNTESPLDPKEWKEFKLVKVEPYNWNTSRFVFELPNGDASRLPVSSCVMWKGPESLKDKNGKPVIRPYTPTSASDEPGKLEFIVKQYPWGLLSKHVNEMKEGETMSMKGPIVKIPWKTNEFQHVGMVAGGSGITPMWQVLQHALADPANKTKFTLLFGNVEERDILLREDFDRLSKKYPDTFKVVHVLEKGGENWKGPKGYINKDVMKEHFAAPGDGVKILVCGPPPQVDATAGKKDGMKQGPLAGALKELGYTEEQVFKF